MKCSGTCPKCGSAEIAADMKAADRTHMHTTEMTVAISWKLKGALVSESRESTVSAWVCLGCGFIEYYADRPERLKLPESVARQGSKGTNGRKG